MKRNAAYGLFYEVAKNKKRPWNFLPMALRMISEYFYLFLKTTGAGNCPGKRRARRRKHPSDETYNSLLLVAHVIFRSSSK
jgi:hypothetical protein